MFADDYFEDEVRDGFYVPAIMKRSWAAMLELLSMIAELCDKHSIKWYAAYGTLLGAARHGGFIPWDDDLDICMLREDFELFLNYAREELSGCYIANSFSDEKGTFLAPCVTVRNSLTPLFREPNTLSRYHGFPYPVFVDVFPYDNLSRNPERERLRDHIWLDLNDIASFLAKGEFSERDIESALSRSESVLGIHNMNRGLPIRERIVRLDREASALFRGEAADYVGNVGLYAILGAKYPKSAFSETIMLPFEGMSMRVPAAYEEVLRACYGNWRKKVRGGTAHGYPFFKDMASSIEAISSPSHLFPMKINEDMLRNKGQTDCLPAQFRAGRHLGEWQEILSRIPALISYMGAEEILGLLKKLQDDVVHTGTLLEKSGAEQMGTAVSMLESFCESVYRAYLFFSSGSRGDGRDIVSQDEFSNASATISSLKDELKKIVDFILSSNGTRREVAFFPRRARDWKAMESIWKAAKEDPEWNVSVVPVPWRYRDGNGETAGETYYEGGEFPDYVPIVPFQDYDVAARCPDIVIIQIPYDEYNNAMSIHPDFYARELRKHTRRLVYIPWFVTDEFDAGKKMDPADYTMLYYALTPGVVFSDLIIVQSEKMKETYVRKLTEMAGEGTEGVWKEKIQGLGSPVMEAPPGEGYGYGEIRKSALWETISKYSGL